MKSTYCKSVLLIAICTAAAPAVAAVSAEEASQLGQTLTAWGSEKAGNKEGTIPAYTGERPKPPASYNPKEPGTYPDPYNEKPSFSITAQNLSQYGNKLSDGQKNMFKIYPNYRMDIYPTHRTTAHSPTFIENTLKNATSCKTAGNGLRLEGCLGGFPFPIPKTGNEVMWNHALGLPLTYNGFLEAYIVDRSGSPVLQGRYITRQQSPFLDPAVKGPRAPDSVYSKLRFDALAPARKVGENTIIIDSLDPINPGRRAWQYVPGQRRVKLAPDLAYDTPSPASGGSATMDQVSVFFGAQDRYEMRLVGKKELFLMGNNFDLTDPKKCPVEKLLTKNFYNPDCVRWELRRAWVVEATLKPGYRHVLPKRVFYFDEDGYQSALGDSWDASGHIYRMDSNVVYPWYDKPYGEMGTSNITYDFATGAYATVGVYSCPKCGLYGVPQAPDTYFSPEALAGSGVR